MMSPAVAVEEAVTRPFPAQIPASVWIAARMRYYRTGLFRQPRFRNNMPMLFPAVRFALLVRSYMSGQGFLYGLRLPVSPFPTPAQSQVLCVNGPTVSE